MIIIFILRPKDLMQAYHSGAKFFWLTKKSLILLDSFTWNMVITKEEKSWTEATLRFWFANASILNDRKKTILEGSKMKILFLKILFITICNR